ncbi:alpha/beta fold hydrolase [Actinoplanes sp. NPDC049316]|uniref:alpha/beta fold hydrolase n=1 Tax=Actinoplanes sp. NPDC049316 TaxID=3154727 RepID=UPI0034373F5B
MPLPLRLFTAGAAGLALATCAVVPASAAVPRRAAATGSASAALRRTAATAPASAAARRATTAPASAAARPATTGSAEARRVGRVATPKLRWYACYGWAQCATAEVPLDYDHPYGEQTTLALLRVRAKDRKHRIGSLFVNPGGPGASATSFALMSPMVLSDSLLRRFDIVGMDPRGIGASDPVSCFTDPGRQAAALKGMNVAFPVGAKETAAYLRSARKLATGCSTTGRSLAGAMSTAEVARDMDVMRRAVGDKKLSYLGFSYGTALGQYYAAMFPDRFRAIAVDGVINPRSWAGTAQTQHVIQDERLHSAEGAERALHRILTLCDRAGETKCEFAAGDPVRRFGILTRRLQAKPVTVEGTKITYAALIGEVLGALYGDDAAEQVTAMASDLWTLTSAHPSGGAAAAATSSLLRRFGRGFPYDNSVDAYASVMCTDGLHPAHAGSWPAKVAKATKRAPYFGPAWAWASAPCARDTWTVRDEDAWTGPFDRPTRNTVLVVGSYWDPATNYYQAVSSSRLLGNARLLSSDNFGHTAYGTSACVTAATDRYLLAKTLPAAGTVCRAEQPFTGPLTDVTEAAAGFDLATATKAEIVEHGLPAEGAVKQRPPVGHGPF